MLLLLNFIWQVNRYKRCFWSTVIKNKKYGVWGFKNLQLHIRSLLMKWSGGLTWAESLWVGVIKSKYGVPKMSKTPYGVSVWKSIRLMCLVSYLKFNSKLAMERKFHFGWIISWSLLTFEGPLHWFPNSGSKQSFFFTRKQKFDGGTYSIEEISMIGKCWIC